MLLFHPDLVACNANALLSGITVPVRRREQCRTSNDVTLRECPDHLKYTVSSFKVGVSIRSFIGVAFALIYLEPHC